MEFMAVKTGLEIKKENRIQYKMNEQSEKRPAYSGVNHMNCTTFRMI